VNQPLLEVADILRRYGADFLSSPGISVSGAQRRVMQALEACRTAALGGHLDQCDQCGHRRISYNSCRNRHCPKCQSLAKAEWLKARQQELLPVSYFHVVFTIPECFASLALQNKRVMYNLLFRAASQTLLRIAADPRHLGAELGFFAVLHTWGQNLLHHPHVHCVVPGGGLSPDGKRWISCRQDFFLPVRVLSRLFRRLFLQGLHQSYAQGQLQFQQSLHHLAEPAAFNQLLRTAQQTEWVVYAKPPFGGPLQVLHYLGRYTHRVAISNQRLLGCEKGQVSFRWKDYRQGHRTATMTLSATEFIRRFLLHVLPDGFQRIRYFGWMGNRHRATKLTQCRTLLNYRSGSQTEGKGATSWQALYEELTRSSVDTCPVCQRGRMILIEQLPMCLMDKPPP
jgi:hypothetical protein